MNVQYHRTQNLRIFQKAPESQLKAGEPTAQDPGSGREYVAEATQLSEHKTQSLRDETVKKMRHHRDSIVTPGGGCQELSSSSS